MMKTLNKSYEREGLKVIIIDIGAESIIIQFIFAIAVKHLILIRRLRMIMT